jgi:hypothetical protein
MGKERIAYAQDNLRQASIASRSSSQPPLPPLLTGGIAMSHVPVADLP